MRLSFLGFSVQFGQQSEGKASSPAPLIYMAYAGQERGVAYKRNPIQYAEEAYRKNVIAYKAISEVARGAAKIPMKVMVGDREADASHPLVKLLARPNPWSGHSQFVEAAVAYLMLTGNSYIEGVGPENQPPLELWPLRPDRTKVKPGRTGPAGFVYDVNGQIRTWEVDPITGSSPVLHLKFFHPNDDWYGMSPVEAACFAVDAHNEAGAWNQSLLQNGCRPSGALVYRGAGNGSPASLSDKQYETLKQQLNDAYAGGRNAGRPMLLEGGMEWQQMSMSPADMDWLSGKATSAREIALAFGVPPMILAIPGDNTYSNYQEARQALYQETVIPIAESLVDGLNSWLAPLYGDNVRIVLYTEDLPALAGVRAARWQSVTQATWMTLNEKRLATGLPAIDNAGADEVFMPSTLVPLGGALEPEDGDETQPEDDASETQEIEAEDADEGEGEEGAAATGGGKPAGEPVATDQVQGTALNGAQIQALLQIVQSVADGVITVDAAEAMVRISFPLTADAAVEQLLSALAKLPKRKPGAGNAPA